MTTCNRSRTKRSVAAATRVPEHHCEPTLSAVVHVAAGDDAVTMEFGGLPWCFRDERWLLGRVEATLDELFLRGGGMHTSRGPYRIVLMPGCCWRALAR